MFDSRRQKRLKDRMGSHHASSRRPCLLLSLESDDKSEDDNIEKKMMLFVNISPCAEKLLLFLCMCVKGTPTKNNTARLIKLASKIF